MLGIVKSYPIINEAGEIAWPGKYPTLDDVEKAKQRLGSESAWQREYLLKIVPDDERIIQPDWIKYYKELPSEKSDDYRFVLTAIDLAISQNESADKTAMVSAKVFGWDKNLRIYILPDPVNERLTTLKAQERAELLSMTLGNGTPTKLIVENVAYQAAFIEMMNQRNIPTEKFDLQGQDKTARLSLAASLVQSGKVQFPEAGAEELINQLVNFGFQRYDDLADAFAMLILETIEQTKYMNYSVDFV
ncbi:MAG: hypothetical protein NTY61_00855 [Candidatus Parcubacteria bacterium]|nr:hypothetical protein [Candidatus Parcubacteria bacterium]